LPPQSRKARLPTEWLSARTRTLPWPLSRASAGLLLHFFKPVLHRGKLNPCVPTTVVMSHACEYLVRCRDSTLHRTTNSPKSATDSRRLPLWPSMAVYRVRSSATAIGDQ
jgi:hypothetical protein